MHVCVRAGKLPLLLSLSLPSLTSAPPPQHLSPPLHLPSLLTFLSSSLLFIFSPSFLGFHGPSFTYSHSLPFCMIPLPVTSFKSFLPRFSLSLSSTRAPASLSPTWMACQYIRLSHPRPAFPRAIFASVVSLLKNVNLAPSAYENQLASLCTKFNQVKQRK